MEASRSSERNRYGLGAVVWMLGVWSGLGGAPTAAWLQPEHCEVLSCVAPDERIRLRSASAPGGLFRADESVDLTVQVLTPASDAEAILLEIQEISSQGDRNLDRMNAVGTAWLPAIETVGSPTRREFPLDLAAGEGATNTVELRNLPVPQRFGTYAVTATLGDGSRQFLCTVARVRTVPGLDVWTTPILGDGDYLTADDWDAERLLERAEALRRLGVIGVRVQLGWSEPSPGRYDWRQSDRLLGTMKGAGLKALVTLTGHPTWSMPFGEPTPSVSWSNPDWTCLPKYREVFGLFVHQFCSRYWQGGEGALWALEHWNEPWEGISINGWQSDSHHYRALMEELARNARRVDPRIRTAAASSIMNTELKFLTGDKPGSRVELLDVFTDHYIPPASSYGPMVAAYWGKQSMDTEAWVAANETRLGQVMVQWLACGQRRVTPWQAGMVAFGVPGGAMQYQMPTTVAPATAAFNALMGGRRFEGLLFQTHLPWAFQFGQGNGAVVALVGRLLPLGRGGTSELLWSQAALAEGGTILIDNSDGALQFFDLCGNPEYQGHDQVRIPADPRLHYVRAPEGGVRLIKHRLASAQLSGFRPVEIIAHDFTRAPGLPGAELRVTLHNLLNRDLGGTLAVTAPAGVDLDQDRRELRLGVGETRDFQFAVRSIEVLPSNAYVFRFHFESDAGAAGWEETLHDGVIRKVRIDVDGSLDDWRRVPSMVLTAGTNAAGGVFDEICRIHTNAVVGELKLSWDERALYLAARIQNPAPGPLHERLETWDEDQFFWSAADDAVCESLRPFESLLLRLPDDPGDWGRFQKDPDWSGFSRLMETNLTARHLALTRAAQVYFRARQGDPTTSFARASHVYKQLPWNSRPYIGDTLQIGFDVLPGYDHHQLQPDTDRVPDGFHAMPDTDFEFCLYACGDGGTEVWRCLAPGVPRSPLAPRQPRAQIDQGPVDGAECIVVRAGSSMTYEAAIPWREFAGWKPQVGASLGIAFRFNNHAGFPLTFGIGKSAAKANSLTLHPYHETSPSCGVRWVLGAE